MINWNGPKFGNREKELVNEVLESGYVSEGPKTKELEEKLAKIVGTKHVIMTTSCTAALYLSIQADKIIRGYSEGEVIIPDLTFLATKNAIEMAGLKPKILDVDKGRFLLGKLEGNYKQVIIVNLLGRSNRLFNNDFIYDNAGCLGSNVPNGKVGCYSLQGNKIISCGQGGFCATDDDEYNKVIREQKDFGRNRKEENDTVGFNFKFNDILSAVVLGQLETLENRKELLVKQYVTYMANLCGVNGIRFISWGLESGEVPLWVEVICKERDKLVKYLEGKEILPKKPWKAIIGLPNAKYYSDNVLWLPNGSKLSELDIKIICEKIKEFYNENKKSS